MVFETVCYFQSYKTLKFLILCKLIMLFNYVNIKK